MNTRLLLGIVLLCCSLTASAQELFLPLNHQLYYRTEEYLNLINDSSKQFFTAIKPYRIADMNRVMDTDSILRRRYKQSRFGKTFIGRKLLHKHLLQLDSAKFSLAVSPLVNLQYGKDLAVNPAQTYTINTRGLMVQGTIGKTVAFYAAYLETQSQLFPYLADYVKKYQVVPNFGRYKPFKTNGYDYGIASGYVSWSPIPKLNIQFGNDKNFIGEGYRSFLLSDNSFNYPFLKFTANLWKLKYYVLMAQLQDGITQADPQQPFAKKFLSVHYLGFNLGKRIQIGIFEGTIWEGKSLAKVSYNFANPILFSSWAQNGLAGRNNTNLGLNVKLKVFNRTHLYGQFMLDDLGGSTQQDTIPSSPKFAFQGGLKMYDFLFIRNFFWQVEFNQCAPYTYSSNRAGNVWSHYNQSLTHPTGANFREVLSFLSYRYGRFWVEAKGLYCQYGRDSIAGISFGRSIFDGDQGGKVGKAWFQGQKASLAYADFRIGFIINPAYNLNIQVGINNRWESYGSTNSKIQYFYAGIQTSLYNLVQDF
ncbi:MAG: hypothetical protein K1X82_01780 [Bacteroidia bacterium]|nr:hypothetical protein [Bacteroidia bacterium]